MAADVPDVPLKNKLRLNIVLMVLMCAYHYFNTSKYSVPCMSFLKLSKGLFALVLHSRCVSAYNFDVFQCAFTPFFLSVISIEYNRGHVRYVAFLMC